MNENETVNTSSNVKEKEQQETHAERHTRIKLEAVAFSEVPAKEVRRRQTGAPPVFPNRKRYEDLPTPPPPPPPEEVVVLTGKHNKKRPRSSNSNSKSNINNSKIKQQTLSVEEEPMKKKKPNFLAGELPPSILYPPPPPPPPLPPPPKNNVLKTPPHNSHHPKQTTHSFPSPSPSPYYYPHLPYYYYYPSSYPYEYHPQRQQLQHYYQHYYPSHSQDTMVQPSKRQYPQIKPRGPRGAYTKSASSTNNSVAAVATTAAAAAAANPMMNCQLIPTADRSHTKTSTATTAQSTCHVIVPVSEIATAIAGRDRKRPSTLPPPPAATTTSNQQDFGYYWEDGKWKIWRENSSSTTVVDEQPATVTEPQGVSMGAAKHTRPQRKRGPIRGKTRGPYKKKVTATADTTSSNSQKPAVPRRNVVCSMPPCPSIIRTTTTTANSNDNARMETIKKAAREHALAPAAVESNFKASDLKAESPTLSASAAATSAIDNGAGTGHLSNGVPTNILQLLQKERKERQHERKMLEAKLAMLVKAKSKTKKGVPKLPLTEEQQKINHNNSFSKSYYKKKKDSNNHDSDVAVSNDNDDSGDALLLEEHPTEKKYGTTSIGKEETQQNWNNTAMLEEPMDADTTTTTTGTAAKPVTSKPKASSNELCCGTGKKPNNIGTFPDEEDASLAYEIAQSEIELSTIQKQSKPTRMITEEEKLLSICTEVNNVLQTATPESKAETRMYGTSALMNRVWEEQAAKEKHAAAAAKVTALNAERELEALCYNFFVDEEGDIII